MRRLVSDLIVLIAIAIIVGTFLVLAGPRPVQAACHPEPVTVNTPSGIAGCYQWGRGIASHYGPGDGVAMNFCTWTLRHKQGCGRVRIVSLDTGNVTVVPVVDFCDCYWTTDRRIVDLQYGVVAQLGLDLSRGLYRVSVHPTTGEREEHAVTPAMTLSSELPDTAMQP